MHPKTCDQIEFVKRKRSIYLPSEKVENVLELDRLGKPISEILKAINFPKTRKDLIVINAAL
ncbi:MAG: hypothetical protein IM473_03875 [Microcystis sp. M015S2]|jgi:hypothetical protein|uniref:hypothetical protein n=1 Tax=unclassified Microcystis TaxID=2643300 RepID=UPI00258C660F|nr:MULTISPECIES: hypothetical protein [unclassified Microcystis]MCA2708365.1 hypothetical protein [Microcystis sp. M025S2]MCA2741568.1 hypothetical protein [Microcystis sp. M015S2]MCA2759031.1 hypothetical protein [Microcystis sp. M145S2]